MINEDRNTTTQFILAKNTEHSVSHLWVLFFSCVFRKAAAHVGKKRLNMCHQAQNSFRGIVIGIPQHKKRYLVYKLITRNIISSYDIRFDKIIFSTLEYTSRNYS